MKTYDKVNVNELQPLPRNFFDGDVESVARALIGTFLFTVDGEENLTGGQIVETEAYDQNDPAAHCYCRDGIKPLKLGAAEAMFLPGGHAYIYGTQFNWCLNFVCGDKCFGSAVLIRALKPVVVVSSHASEGNELQIMRKRRYQSNCIKDHAKFIKCLCHRPGTLCEALNLSNQQNRHCLFNDPFKLWARPKNYEPKIVSGPRVNVDKTILRMQPNLPTELVREAIEKRWRFADDRARAFVGVHRTRFFEL